MLTTFPYEYFKEEAFESLEFVNMNFNNFALMKMPEACARFHYCFKRTLIVGKDGNQLNTVPNADENVIERSADKLIFANVLL